MWNKLYFSTVYITLRRVIDEGRNVVLTTQKPEYEPDIYLEVTTEEIAQFETAQEALSHFRRLVSHLPDRIQNTLVKDVINTGDILMKQVMDGRVSVRAHKPYLLSLIALVLESTLKLAYAAQYSGKEVLAIHQYGLVRFIQYTENGNIGELIPDSFVWDYIRPGKIHLSPLLIAYIASDNMFARTIGKLQFAYEKLCLWINKDNSDAYPTIRLLQEHVRACLTLFELVKLDQHCYKLCTCCNEPSGMKAMFHISVEDLLSGRPAHFCCYTMNPLGRKEIAMEDTEITPDMDITVFYYTEDTVKKYLRPFKYTPSGLQFDPKIKGPPNKTVIFSQDCPIIQKLQVARGGVEQNLRNPNFLPKPKYQTHAPVAENFTLTLGGKDWGNFFEPDSSMVAEYNDKWQRLEDRVLRGEHEYAENIPIRSGGRDKDVENWELMEDTDLLGGED